MQFVRSEAISDYLLTPEGVRPLAAGVLFFGEKPGPVFAPFLYPEEGPGGAIAGYSPAFSFRARLVPDDPACALLWDIARSRRIGDRAETFLYRVERFSGAPCQARRIRVAVAVEEIQTTPGESVTLEGTFHQLGDAQEGTFDPTALVFTPAQA